MATLAQPILGVCQKLFEQLGQLRLGGLRVMQSPEFGYADQSDVANDLFRLLVVTGGGAVENEASRARRLMLLPNPGNVSGCLGLGFVEGAVSLKDWLLIGAQYESALRILPRGRVTKEPTLGLFAQFLNSIQEWAGNFHKYGILGPEILVAL